MPIDYKNYPDNWRSEIRPAILKRAKNRCEWCNAPNGMYGSRGKNGEFIPALAGEIADGMDYAGNRVIKIVLTIAHLNHDINDNRPENLAALCQRCHLSHDKDQHRASRYNNRVKNIPDLFGKGGK